MAGEEEVIRKLDRILSYLEDDPSTGRKGIYSRQSDMENRLNRVDQRLYEVEKKQSQWKVTLAKVAAFFGLGGGTATFAWLKWETFVEFLKHIGKA